LAVEEAKERMISHLEREGIGRGTVKYKLRDWLFSRQRYWGEPFPIVLDDQGNPYAVTNPNCPSRTGDEDFKPTGTPAPPLVSKAMVALRKPTLRRGTSAPETFTRETNTMPQWAGSCWYYLRYIDPHNETASSIPTRNATGCRSISTSAACEHAVLHLLYARFWHKVCSTSATSRPPSRSCRLVNQGRSWRDGVHTCRKGIYRAAARRLSDTTRRRADHLLRPAEAECKSEVERTKDGYVLKSDPSVRVERAQSR
jgi:leucyl-tRNA synthetase